MRESFEPPALDIRFTRGPAPTDHAFFRRAIWGLPGRAYLRRLWIDDAGVVMVEWSEPPDARDRAEFERETADYIERAREGER
jgi:hypothetical protein